MRKLTLAAITALAAMAFTTTAAQADTVLNVVDYPSGISCADYGEIVVDGNDVTGGCPLDISGEVNGDFTTPVWQEDCMLEGLNARVSAAGEIYIPNPDFNGGMSCYIKPCENEATGDVQMWTGQLAAAGQLEDGAVAIDLDICVENSPGGYQHHPIETSGQFSGGFYHDDTDISTSGTLPLPASEWHVNLNGDNQVWAWEYTE